MFASFQTDRGRLRYHSLTLLVRLKIVFHHGETPSAINLNPPSVIAEIRTINFDSYLAMLEENISPNTFGIASDAPIETIIAALEAELRVKFDPPDSDAQGYPVHRCALRPPQTPEWLWLNE